MTVREKLKSLNERLKDTVWVREKDSCEGCLHRVEGLDIVVNDYDHSEIKEMNKINPSPLGLLIEEHGSGRYTHCGISSCFKKNY